MENQTLKHTKIMPHRLTTSMDKIYILAGNLTVWLSASLTTFTFTGEDFRAWTSWGMGLIVGILTVAKLLKGRSPRK